MRILLTLLMFGLGIQVFAQVTFEESYEIGYNNQFWLTSIEEGNEKYVEFDRIGNEFSVYNLDHSLFLNVVIPIPLDDIYNIGYITTSLFDCDNSNIEYTVMAQSDFSKNFYIFRENGDLVWSMDSVLAPYCYGCNTGSVVNQPIKNTADGTKLFLMNSGYTEIGVYSLCGELPTNVFEFAQTNQLVEVFPNPSSETLNFKVVSPTNSSQTTLVLTDLESKTMATIKVDTDGMETVDVSSWSQGTYFYSLRTENKVFQSGKFQIVR